MNLQLSNALNLLRWVAAFMVVLGHLRSFVFVEHSLVDNEGLLIKLFYFVTGFGHQGVIVFFVVSGYLVGGSVLKKYVAKELSKEYFQGYFVRRFLRIYMVLIPALIIGFAIDSFGYTLFPQLYANFFEINAMNFNAYENLDIQTFLGNILNMQTIFVDNLGTNGPLWSLAYEWSYYFLFLFLFVNNYFRILFLFLVVVLLLTNSNILIYGLIWLLGALAILSGQKIINSYFSIALFIVILAISRKYSGFSIDLMIGLSLIMVILSLKSSVKTGTVLFVRCNHYLAEFSYSTYLFHFPFLVLALSILYFFDVNAIRLQPELFGFTIYFGVLLSIYGYSYLMYLCFEKHTHMIQKKAVAIMVGK